MKFPSLLPDFSDFDPITMIFSEETASVLMGPVHIGLADTLLVNAMKIAAERDGILERAAKFAMSRKSNSGNNYRCDQNELAISPFLALISPKQPLGAQMP